MQNANVLKIAFPGPHYVGRLCNSGRSSHVFLKAIHVVTWGFTLCLIHTVMLQYCFTHCLCSRNRTVPPLQQWPNSNSWLVQPHLLSCLSSGRVTQQVVLACRSTFPPSRNLVKLWIHQSTGSTVHTVVFAGVCCFVSSRGKCFFT